LRVDSVKRLGDLSYPLGLSGSKVRAGMYNQTEDPKLFASGQFIFHCKLRSGEYLPVDSTQVDKIRCVSNNGTDPRPNGGRFEFSHLIFAISSSCPPIGLLCKHLHGGATGPFSTFKCHVDSASNGHVCAEKNPVGHAGSKLLMKG
jgi:hypothetical protein